MVLNGSELGLTFDRVSQGHSLKKATPSEGLPLVALSVERTAPGEMLLRVLKVAVWNGTPRWKFETSLLEYIWTQVGHPPKHPYS